MNILLLRRSRLDVSGVTRFIAELAQGFKKLGHKVTILAYDIDQYVEEWFKDYNIVLIGSKKHVSFKTILYKWYFKGSRIVNELNPDMVIENGIVPLRSTTFKFGVFHGPLVLWKERANMLARYTFKFIVRHYLDYKVAVSLRAKKEYEKIMGIKIDEVIPIAINLEKYPEKPLPFNARERKVVHVGTSKRKRPDISIETVKVLQQRGLNVKLIVIGQYDEKLLKKVNTDSVHFVGTIADKELINYLCKSLAVLIPSEAETFSYIAVEAFACGTPVIASPGIPEDVVIDGYNGLRTSSWNPYEFSLKVMELLQEPRVWQQISSNAHHWVQRLDAGYIASRYCKAYALHKR